MDTFTCEKIKAQLIENLHHTDYPEWVNEHVRKCRSCREFAAKFRRFRHSFSERETDDIQPAPWVLASLDRHLEQKRSENITGLDRLYRWIYRILNRQIPVYQAALSGAIFVIIALVLISGLNICPKISNITKKQVLLFQ